MCDGSGPDGRRRSGEGRGAGRKPKDGELALHGDLVAERAAHTRALMDNMCLQRDRKKAVEEKKKAVRLLAVEKTKRENSTVIEQLKKDV